MISVKRHQPSLVPVKRHQVWRRDRIEALRAALAETLEAELTRTSAEEVMQAHLREIFSVAAQDERAFEAQLRAFLLILQVIELHYHHGGLSTRVLLALLRRARAILEAQRVRPNTSRLAYLHDELHAGLSRAAARESEAWTTAWMARLAGGARPEEDAHRALVDDAHLHLQLGLAKEAAGRLLAAELPQVLDADLLKLRLVRLKILRLGGALREARRLCDAMRAQTEHCALDWESACIEAMQSADLGPLSKFARTKRDCRTPARLLELFLWGRCTQSKAWLSATPKVSTLKRTSAVFEPNLMLYATALERAYNASVPIEKRVRALGNALKTADQIEDPALAMMVWASAARWLVRVKRRSLAALPLSRYRALCLGLTHGEQEDLLRVAGDLLAFDEEHSGALSDFEFISPQNALEPELRARGAALSKMALSLGRVYAERAFSHLLGRPEKKDARAVEYAEILVRYLDELKGPLMKVGQMVSFYGFDLPEEARSIFSELHSATPQVPPDDIVAVIEREFHAPLERLFSNFQYRPIGTGSIGQVHAATLVDGREVAVKVQYPGMVRAVRSDFRGLKMIAPLLRLMMPRWDIDGLLKELETELLRECDYLQEAKNQEEIAARFQSFEGLYIPRVIFERTTPHVLTMERFKGQTFELFSRGASAARRAKAARIITEFWIRSTLVERIFNTDMQPGNLLFSDDVVCVLDFGNTRRWTRAEGQKFFALIEAILFQDRQGFKNSFSQLGVVVDEAQFDYEWAYDRLSGGLMGYLNAKGPVSLRYEDVQRELQHFFDADPSARFAVVPAHQLFPFRVYWSTLATLAGLGAEFDFSGVVRTTLRSQKLF